MGDFDFWNYFGVFFNIKKSSPSSRYPLYTGCFSLKNETMKTRPPRTGFSSTRPRSTFTINDLFSSPKTNLNCIVQEHSRDEIESQLTFLPAAINLGRCRSPRSAAALVIYAQIICLPMGLGGGEAAVYFCKSGIYISLWSTWLQPLSSRGCPGASTSGD